MKHEYGTIEYYAELFADIIADAQHEDQKTGDNLITGFKLAITEWRDYHAKQVLELDRIEAKLNDKN